MASLSATAEGDQLISTSLGALCSNLLFSLRSLNPLFRHPPSLFAMRLLVYCHQQVIANPSRSKHTSLARAKCCWLGKSGALMCTFHLQERLVSINHLPIIIRSCWALGELIAIERAVQRPFSYIYYSMYRAIVVVVAVNVYGQYISSCSQDDLNDSHTVRSTEKRCWLSISGDLPATLNYSAKKTRSGHSQYSDQRQCSTP